jgi:hypothetical protein
VGAVGGWIMSSRKGARKLVAIRRARCADFSQGSYASRQARVLAVHDLLAIDYSQRVLCRMLRPEPSLCVIQHSDRCRRYVVKLFSCFRKSWRTCASIYKLRSYPCFESTNSSAKGGLGNMPMIGRTGEITRDREAQKIFKPFYVHFATPDDCCNTTLPMRLIQ